MEALKYLFKRTKNRISYNLCVYVYTVKWSVCQAYIRQRDLREKCRNHVACVVILSYYDLPLIHAPNAKRKYEVKNKSNPITFSPIHKSTLF